MRETAEFSLDNWGDGKWGMKERELDVVVGAGGPPVDIMACEERMSAAATECVMCGEGRERPQQNMKTVLWSGNFGIRPIQRGNDRPTREKSRQSHSRRRIGADKKQLDTVQGRGGATERTERSDRHCSNNMNAAEVLQNSLVNTI